MAGLGGSFPAVAAGTLSVDYRLQLRRGRRMENEIKVDLGERSREAALRELARIALADHLRDEPVTRCKGEVIVQQWIAGDVDLGGEMTVAGRRNEEMDVCWAPAMPT